MTSLVQPAARAHAPDDAASGTTVTPEASRVEHLVFLAAGLWLMAGLCLDGWAHRTQPELETFWTPWHAVFYSGFTAAAGWLAWMVIRRRPSTNSLRAAIPVGYELSAVGFGVFAAGGVGDAIWHTVFGVESSIDALLSPTHLVMLVGMSMAVTAPVRAFRGCAAGSFGSFLPVTLSLALVTTGVAFFFLYANGFSNWMMTRPFIPYETEMMAGFGVLATVASTVILLGPLFYALRRWEPPFGTFTVVFGVVGVFMAGLDAFSFSWQLLAPVVGGLTADVLIRSAGRRWWLIGLGVPLVMWSVSALATHLAWGVAWPPSCGSARS